MRRCGSRNAVVALKPAMVSSREGLQGRSRNAVVALKLRKGRGGPGGGSAKQERRGGIETVTLGACRPLAANEAGTPWWH